VAAARADTRTAAKPTADQMRMVKMLEQLASAADWRGVAAQERENSSLQPQDSGSPSLGDDP
jgi:hypothetical protein